MNEKLRAFLEMRARQQAMAAFMNQAGLSLLGQQSIGLGGQRLPNAADHPYMSHGMNIGLLGPLLKSI